MADGGRLLLDVHSEQHFRTLSEQCTIAEGFMDGFWATDDDIGVHQTLLSPEEPVALDRYLIVEPERTRVVHNWLTHLTIDGARAEFAAAGFDVVRVLGDVAGAPLDPTAPEYALLATPAPR